MENGETVLVMWEVIIWMPGVEGAKMVLGKVKDGQTEARNEWLVNLWKEVRDKSRGEVEDWVDEKVRVMARWFQREEVVKGTKMDWSKMVDGVPRYIEMADDVGCLGLDSERWVVYEKAGRNKSKNQVLKHQMVMEKKKDERRKNAELSEWERRGG